MCIFEIGLKNFTLDNLTTMVVGFGAVFVLLIVISFFISLLKYLPKLFSKKEAEEKPVSSADERSATSSEANLTDNKALIAVITAAIHAFNEEKQGMDGPRDQYVVRSIRRVSR